MRIRDKFSDAWVIRPGDHVALIVKGEPDEATVRRMSDQLKEKWADIDVVIISGDVELRVLRWEHP